LRRENNISHYSLLFIFRVRYNLVININHAIFWRINLMIDQIQFTLTVNTGKWIIAKALSEKKEIKEAISEGRVLLFGGTTVSAISELLTGKPLRISGRISKRGTVTAYKKIVEKPHTLMIHKGHCNNIEQNSNIDNILKEFGHGDYIITGANGFDKDGNALLMSGGYGLGTRRNLLAPIYTEGGKIIITAGLEKLIPGSIRDVINNTGHNLSSWSMGSSVGVVPIIGEIFTEIEAVHTLTGNNPIAIGRGGINGAEGSTTFVLKGEKNKLDYFKKIIKWAANKDISGVRESFLECTPGVKACSRHKACCYKMSNF
jgi:hypothetical protein